MTQNEVTIIKNAILDSTEAYVEAKLATCDFVKTQIGVVQSYVERNKKYYHVVKCDNGRVTYNNVLSVGNIPFPENSTVFLIAPNAQFSNQFILGKLDDTPCSIRGGSININDKFIVNPDGTMTAKAGTFEGSIVVNNGVFTVDEQGNMKATSGEIGDLTLKNGSLYAMGELYVVSNKTIYPTVKTNTNKTVISFVCSEIGVLSNFKLTFDYSLTVDAGRTSNVKLRYYNSGVWEDIESYSLNTADIGSIQFNTIFAYNSEKKYRIVIEFESVDSNTPRQTYRCSVHTNRAIKTALNGDGYMGDINSSNATIGNINLNSGVISSLNSSSEEGFYINDNMLILNDDGDDLLTYRTYGLNENYNYAGLFVRCPHPDVTLSDKAGITLANNINNYFRLEEDGHYIVVVNGTSTGGYIQGGSDKRIKENIISLDTQMSKDLINATNTYKFKYKNMDGMHYGVIAQEAREVLDNLGEKDVMLEYGIGDTNIKDQRNISYLEYIPPLINYVKDLQKQIDELKKEDK